MTNCIMHTRKRKWCKSCNEKTTKTEKRIDEPSGEVFKKINVYCYACKTKLGEAWPSKLNPKIRCDDCKEKDKRPNGYQKKKYAYET